jgi:hypothetical protein
MAFRSKLTELEKSKMINEMQLRSPLYKITDPEDKNRNNKDLLWIEVGEKIEISGKYRACELNTAIKYRCVECLKEVQF